MKKFAFLLIIAFMATGVQAQSNAISKHFAKFQTDTSYTKISVTSRMFSLFTEIEAEDEDEEEILAAMAKLKGIKAIIKNQSKNSRDLYVNAVNTFENDSSYEELMTVEDAGENIRFMVRDEADKIAELLMVVGGNKQFMVMSLYGEIDLNSIAKLSRVLKINGMDAFKALEQQGAKE